MNTERALPPFYADAHRRQDRVLPYSRSKRKFSSLISPTGDILHAYPSPPMSSPPSPPLTTQEHSRTTLSEYAPHFTASSTAIAPMAAALPAQSQGFHTSTLLPPVRSNLPQAQPSTFSNLPSIGSAALGGRPSVQLSSFGVLHPVTNGALGTATFTTSSGLSNETPSRSGRKSKAHVASACVNCKRAHLSCDVQRPCARCVASGKQDSCYDVQHKKRGRPRLREESEFKIEQMVPELPSGATIPPPSIQTSSRPIATPRQRRADSLRSLRSQTSEGSSLPTPNLPPPSALQSPFSYPRPPPSFTLAPAEVPTAFLDVDLVFLRANQPFQQILSEGQDVRGRQIGEVAAPADNETFEDVRNRLRAEREAREPNYMPPIVQSGQDPISGVSEADIERLSYGFADATYTWTRSRAGSVAENFPARVRLAKSTAYFVVVTLPSFRPTPAVATSPVAPDPFMTPHFGSRGLQSAPPQPPAAFPVPATSSSLPPSRRGSLGAYSYPSSQLGTPFQQAIVPSMPPPRPPDFPLESALSAPRGPMREAMPPPVLGTQLAPIGEPIVSPTEPTALERLEAQPPPASSEEEGDDHSPRKRLRVGIEEVIERS